MVEISGVTPTPQSDSEKHSCHRPGKWKSLQWFVASCFYSLFVYLFITSYQGNRLVSTLPEVSHCGTVRRDCRNCHWQGIRCLETVWKGMVLASLDYFVLGTHASPHFQRESESFGFNIMVYDFCKNCHRSPPIKNNRSLSNLAWVSTIVEVGGMVGTHARITQVHSRRKHHLHKAIHFYMGLEVNYS